MATAFDLSAIRSDVTSYAAQFRILIGAGTSSFDGAYGSLSGVPSSFTPSAHNQAWSTITSTPTTLAGYGITDAITSAAVAAGYVALTGAQTVAGVKTFSSIVIAPSFQVGTSSGPRWTTDGTNMICRNSTDTANAQVTLSNIRASGFIWLGGSSATNVHLYGTGSGILEIYNSNETGFDRICLGVGSSSTAGPAIKRNGTAVNFRLANDSTDCPITAGQATFSAQVSVGTFTVATLPSAATNAGFFAQVTDSSVTTNGSTVAGGGANRVPVFSNGTNWIVK